ncbi:MAG: hypothetical protein ACPGQS_05020 [Bradymonadia bacterium]
MNESNLLAAPPITHLVYIPFILVIGIIIGFVMGKRAGKADGRDEYIATGVDDDLL